METNRPPTVADVAARAGVNTVTASIVLNGNRQTKGNTRVSEATRQRILAAAEDLRFQPNAIAQSLRRRRVNIVGFYTGYGHLNAHNAFLSDIIGGLQNGCFEHMMDLLLVSFRGSTQDNVRAAFLSGRMDAVVLQAPEESAVVDYLADSYLPVIAIADASLRVPSVVVDDIGGSVELAQYLAGRGYRNVLYRKKAVDITSSHRRYSAFVSAAAQLGMIVTAVNASSDVQLDATEVRFLADKHLRGRVVVGWHDDALYAPLEYCRAAGIRIPEDVGLAGFDGIRDLNGVDGSLTTMVAPWGEVARTAITQAINLVDGKPIPTESVLPVSLKIGTTTC